MNNENTKMKANKLIKQIILYFNIFLKYYIDTKQSSIKKINF